MICHNFHRFEPYGVSGMVVISESHFSIHTWPEYDYCAIDIFVCGEKVDVEIVIGIIKTYFNPNFIHIEKLDRGKFSKLGIKKNTKIIY